MENHAGRPEIAAALDGRVGRSMRFSRTVQKEMMYVAVPAPPPAAGVVRAALPLGAIDRPLTDLYIRIGLGSLAVALLLAALSLAIGRRITRPLEEMRRGAERFAEGRPRGAPGGSRLRGGAHPGRGDEPHGRPAR